MISYVNMTDAVFIGDSWVSFFAMIHHCKKFGILNMWATPLIEKGDWDYINRTEPGTTALHTYGYIHRTLSDVNSTRETQWFIHTGSNDILYSILDEMELDWDFTDKGEELAEIICNIVRHIVFHNNARKICISSNSIGYEPSLASAVALLFPLTREKKMRYIASQINLPLLKKIEYMKSLFPNVQFYFFNEYEACIDKGFWFYDRFQSIDLQAHIDYFTIKKTHIEILVNKYLHIIQCIWMILCEFYIKFIYLLHIWLVPYFSVILG